MHRDLTPIPDLRLRRTLHGRRKSKAEIIRCLRRYVARKVYPHLRDGG